MRDFGLFLLRAVVGSLMAGHGAQKLFGWFGGFGLKGTSGWLESLGMRPGKPWAIMAGASEFGGGLLTLLGFLNPLGAIASIGAMSMATVKAHWGKPIWNTSGGAELPIINSAAFAAVALLRPGKYSLDNLLGLKITRWLLIPGLLGVAIVTAIGASAKPPSQPEQAEQASTEEESPTEEAREELQSGGQDQAA